MTKDFSKFQKIVDHFRGSVLDDDFEVNFTAKTKHVPKSERFLLKMELKRLASPCTRLIDLRGHVDGECRAFEHEERTHFLDEIAIKTFNENIIYYSGYTFGVYEAVMNTENNFRVIYQREKSNILNPVATNKQDKVLDKTQYPAQLLTYGPYFDRKEERMNFAIPILVTLSNKKEIECTSSDISINGCKLRFNKRQEIKIGQEIEIRFSGLEEEFQFGKNNVFVYKVRNLHQVDKLQLVGLERIYLAENTVDGFKQFLVGFILGNKRRYKINLDNTLQAIQSRTVEQFSLPKINELPIFLDDSKAEVLPRYALTCNNNQNTYQYWQDENRHSTLYCLITPERLLRMKKAATLNKSLIVYSFIHVSQGKFYFYTADDQQLKTDRDFMSQFLGFAAAKSSFAVTQLSLISVDVDKAESPLTLSDALSKKDQHLNLPVPNDVKGILQTLPYIAVALDITSPESIEQYQQLSFEGIETSRLKNFGHKRMSSKLNIDDIGISYINQRQEPRFKYKTPVEVDVQGVKFSGSSQDFSTLGLKLNLDTPQELNKGDVIFLSFPSLQKITSSFELTSLPYEVMRVNKKKTIINLRVYVEKHMHMGRTFFKALIEKNKDKLTPDEYASMSPGLAKALRNIYSQSLTIPSLILQTSGSRYKIETIGCSQEYGKLMSLMKQFSDRTSFYNLYPLLKNAQAVSLMGSTLKKMKTDDAPVVDTFYIAINPEYELVDKAVLSKLSDELKTPKLKRMFISKALQRGHFFCIEVRLSRSDKPDLDFLNPELSYISAYAIHRGKQIEQDIWSVVGTVQILDITQETLIKHDLLNEGVSK